MSFPESCKLSPFLPPVLRYVVCTIWWWNEKNKSCEDYLKDIAGRPVKANYSHILCYIGKTIANVTKMLVNTNVHNLLRLRLCLLLTLANLRCDWRESWPRFLCVPSLLKWYWSTVQKWVGLCQFWSKSSKLFFCKRLLSVLIINESWQKYNVASNDFLWSSCYQYFYNNNRLNDHLL